jgi:hypothetical protein
MIHKGLAPSHDIYSTSHSFAYKQCRYHWQICPPDSPAKHPTMLEGHSSVLLGCYINLIIKRTYGLHPGVRSLRYFLGCKQHLCRLLVNQGVYPPPICHSVAIGRAKGRTGSSAKPAPFAVLSALKLGCAFSYFCLWQFSTRGRCFDDPMGANRCRFNLCKTTGKSPAKVRWEDSSAPELGSDGGRIDSPDLA